MARVIIADDHIVLRQGLRSLLSAFEGVEVIAEAGDGFELLPLVEQLCPDLVVVDLSMPNLGGLEVIPRLIKLKKRPQILVLSAKDDEESVQEAMSAGADGFVPKSSSQAELEFAIKAILKKQVYISPSVCKNVFLHSRNGDSGLRSSPVMQLSAREREVMKLLCEGKPNRNVAKLLHISTRTVDTHRANIMKKLGINSNAELVQIAIKHKIIE